MDLIELESEEHAMQTVATAKSVLPVGGRTKPQLHLHDAEICLLDTRQLSGVTEYEPTEFTFTAKAGTPIHEINQLLSANGQYLPFDAPFAESGSTLGGSIAAGINGSSSLRFGGARDFVLGIHFVDGRGKLVNAGGKVVKNAAGFDLPKFFVGSCGRFGLLTELTLKVFPQPESFTTLMLQGELPCLVEMIKKLLLSPLELDALDLMNSQLMIRLGGPEKAIATSCQRIQSMLSQDPNERLSGEVDAKLWREANQFSWHDRRSHFLMKVPCQVNDMVPLFEIGDSAGAISRAAIGGQVVYFSVPESKAPAIIGSLNSGGYRYLTLSGPHQDREAPVSKASCFGVLSQKVKAALDPENKFLALS